MRYLCLLLLMLPLSPCTAQSNGANWPWTKVSCGDAAAVWRVTAQGNAVVSISGSEITIKLYEARDPSQLFGTIRGTIKNHAITGGLFLPGNKTRWDPLDGIAIYYSGSMNNVPYQVGLNSPPPATVQQVITLTSNSRTVFIGLTRQVPYSEAQ